MTFQTLESRRAELIASFERLTLSWVNTSSNTPTSDPTLPPTSAEKDVNSPAALRRVLADSLRAHAFTLDPYVRGRSVYDRAGTIVGNGRVVWVYPGLDGADAREECGFLAGCERGGKCRQIGEVGMGERE